MLYNEIGALSPQQQEEYPGKENDLSSGTLAAVPIAVRAQHLVGLNSYR